MILITIIHLLNHHATSGVEQLLREITHLFLVLVWRDDDDDDDIYIMMQCV